MMLQRSRNDSFGASFDGSSKHCTIFPDLAGTLLPLRSAQGAKATFGLCDLVVDSPRNEQRDVSEVTLLKHWDRLQTVHC